MSQTTTIDHGCSCGRPECRYDKEWGNPLRETPTPQTTNPSGADVDPLAVLSDRIIDRRFALSAAIGAHGMSVAAEELRKAIEAHTAVAALIAREAELVARNAELEAERDNYRDDYRKVLDVGVNVVADRDRLANENVALREALQWIATGAT